MVPLKVQKQRRPTPLDDEPTENIGKKMVSLKARKERQKMGNESSEIKSDYSGC